MVKAIVEAPPSHAIASGLAPSPDRARTRWRSTASGTSSTAARSTTGAQGPAIHAISGIDIALWDIKGKALGQPIHRLLGGPHRTAIRAYASTLMPDTPEETARVVAGLVERGFTAIKLGWGPFGRDADLDVALVRAAPQGRRR